MVLSSKGPNRAFVVSNAMSTNSTPDGSKRPWNHRLIVALFLVSLIISPISSVNAAPLTTTTATTTTTVVTTNTTITSDSETSDKAVGTRNEIDQPAVIEVTPPVLPSVLRTYSIDVTAYTSTVEECDSDPFITADGSRVRDGIIAANFLPFGTKVRFPSLFGDRVFEVHDRMNKRYNLRADVWMNNGSAMRQFGIHHNVTIEVVQWGNNRDTAWAKRALEAAAVKTAKVKNVK